MSVRRRAIAHRLTNAQRKEIMQRPVQQLSGPARISRLGRYLIWREKRR